MIAVWCIFENVRPTLKANGNVKCSFPFDINCTHTHTHYTPRPAYLTSGNWVVLRACDAMWFQSTNMRQQWMFGIYSLCDQRLRHIVTASIPLEFSLRNLPTQSLPFVQERKIPLNSFRVHVAIGLLTVEMSLWIFHVDANDMECLCHLLFFYLTFGAIILTPHSATGANGRGSEKRARWEVNTLQIVDCGYWISRLA